MKMFRDPPPPVKVRAWHVVYYTVIDGRGNIPSACV